MQSAAAVLLVLLLGSIVDLHAADAPASKPTLADEPYGPHARQRLDFYQAKSETPTPVVFFIHGGGWLNGDKGAFNNEKPYLNAGISVVSINYRLIPDAEADGLVPPVQGPLLDAARALQFVRSKAVEWNLERRRIGASAHR
ncbi:MAG: alpha/beta hydrolase, partial [Prosthecobacter sp.]